MSKKYQTISGKSVRIISVNVRSEDMSVVGLVDEGTYESVETFTKNGKYIGFDMESGMDLIEVKPRIKQTFWFNIYKDPQHTCRHMNKKTQINGKVVEDSLASKLKSTVRKVRGCNVY